MSTSIITQGKRLSIMSDFQMSQHENLNQESVNEKSYLDKLVEVITDPVNLFDYIASRAPKLSDGLGTFSIALAAISLFFVLAYNVPALKMDLKQQQRTQMEKQFDKLVAEGKMSATDAETMIDNQLEMMSGPVGMAMAVVGTWVGGFIIFFISGGLYLLVLKFLLKSAIDFKQVMIAMGLPSIITVITMVAAIVLSLLMGKVIQDVSLASVLSLDKTSVAGLLGGLVAPFQIWSSVVGAIAISKIGKLENPIMAYVLTFGVWFLFVGIGFAFSQM